MLTSATGNSVSEGSTSAWSPRRAGLPKPSSLSARSLFQLPDVPSSSVNGLKGAVGRGLKRIEGAGEELTRSCATLTDFAGGMGIGEGVVGVGSLALR